MRTERVRLLALTVASLVLVAGCAVPGSLDRVLPLPLRIRTTPTSVEVQAAGLADTSAVYLCATAPPYLPNDPADRIDWKPGGDCHDYGTHDTRDGLDISLPLADLVGSPDAGAFRAVPDWYLLLIELDGDRATSSVRSQFHAPKDLPVGPSPSGG
jgi:hypothetical protein